MNKTIAAARIAMSALALSAVAVATPAAAKQYTVMEKLPAEIVGNLNVAAVEVVLGADASEAMAKHDAKAEGKRVAAKLPLHDASVATPLVQDHYETVPFAQMFPLVMKDVTQAWGLTGGRPVKLLVSIDQFKTANAAAAMLIASADVLSGTVEVQDAGDGAKLGRFVVKVINGHSGWGGMLMRGGGVREKMAEEFALESSRVLAGRKSKKIKTRSASN